jgi:hypothetical protein
MVMEKFPDSSDLYSEIGAVTRASKVDFDELSANIIKMEQECKASWDHLKVIAKHDGSTMKMKYVRFEVYTAVTIRNAIFWDVTLCGCCKNRHFGGSYHFHHQGGKNW